MNRGVPSVGPDDAHHPAQLHFTLCALQGNLECVRTMDNDNVLLQAALRYHAMGWSVFPVQNKLPLVKWGIYQTVQPTAEQILEWWTAWPDAGIGCACGCTVVRLDVDGEVPAEELAKFPPSLEFRTPSGGIGRLYKPSIQIDGSIMWTGTESHNELRLQGHGKYTVLPPTPNYQWTNDLPISELPGWVGDKELSEKAARLLEGMKPTYRRAEPSEIQEALQHIPSDDRDDWIMVGMALHYEGDEWLQTWIAWSKTSILFKGGECEYVWAHFRRTPGGVTGRSILWLAEKKFGWQRPHKHELLTDVGNGSVLATACEGKFIYCPAWVKWLRWDGARWTEDTNQIAVEEVQKALLHKRYLTACESLSKLKLNDAIGEDEQTILTLKAARKGVNKVLEHCIRSESAKNIRAAVYCARSTEEMARSHKLFDQHNHLLNCLNGTIDLLTGELLKHDPNNLITQLCPTEYDPNASYARWAQFLEEIMPDDRVRDFLHIFLGHCLTGDVSSQIMPIFHGRGANGRSCMLGTLAHVLGSDYYMTGSRNLLMVKQNSEHPTSVVRLYQKRIVVCIETNEYSKLDEAQVKQLTGSDIIAARHMREDEWEFKPTHKPILITNHLPEVRGTDDAIWRRLPIVPFEVQFLPGDSRRDEHIQEKLVAESSGVLRWLVEGCLKWIANGRKLALPETVRKATTEYRGEQDRIGLFLSECCTIGIELRVRDTELQRSYQQWCGNNQLRPLDNIKFGKALRERGVVKRSGERYYSGLQLKIEVKNG